jgi:hypothetical protein
MTKAPTGATRGALLDVRVTPRASRNGIAGWRDGRLVVRVTAPPVDNAANDAVVLVLAEALDVPKSALRVASGTTSRNKSIEVAGLTRAQVLARVQRRT